MLNTEQFNIHTKRFFKENMECTIIYIEREQKRERDTEIERQRDRKTERQPAHRLERSRGKNNKKAVCSRYGLN